LEEFSTIFLLQAFKSNNNPVIWPKINLHCGGGD